MTFTEIANFYKKDDSDNEKRLKIKIDATALKALITPDGDGGTAPDLLLGVNS